jgi:hypothetical protein
LILEWKDRSLGAGLFLIHLLIMAGLVSAIDVFLPARKKEADARHKAGHAGFTPLTAALPSHRG